MPPDTKESARSPGNGSEVIKNSWRKAAEYDYIEIVSGDKDCVMAWNASDLNANTEGIF